MKYTLICLLFAIIVCTPLNKDILESFKEKRLKRHEKIIECVSKEGSEALKKILNENKSAKLGHILIENKDTISEKDKILLLRCRQKVFSDFKINKNSFFGFRNKTKRLN